MVKKSITIWLEPKDIQNLKQKSEDSGFSGRGAISHYVEKISQESVCFIPKNVRVVLELKK